MSSTVVPPHPPPGSVLTELARCAALARTGGPALDPLADLLRQAGDRLSQPMRVAVVGQIKRGKSTLVNALLGTPVAATGQLELTFTVNELRYAPVPTVRVHYRGDPTPTELPPERLRELTVRDPGHLAHLRRIRKVEFGLPHDLLCRFRLVDTPGLGSVHGVDSANTSEFLGLAPTDGGVAVGSTLDVLHRTARDVHQDSAAELDRADAVLYLFSRALHETDKATLEEFLGDVGGTITPLRAFGVLTRCDQFWPPTADLPGRPDPMTFDPMVAARALADEHLRRPRMRRMFYTILPVSGLLGIGGQTLTDEHLDWLADLATADPRRLVRHAADVGRFAHAPNLSGITLPVAERRALTEQLGAWGVTRACGYVRDGLTPAELRDRLRADSGVSALEDLIASHFGNRSTLLKLDHGLRDADREVARVRLAAQRGGPPVPTPVGEVAAAVERLRARMPAFAELRTLSAFYNGEVTLTAQESAELLRVTGEHGTSCAARLGLPEESAPRLILDRARERVRAWAAREQDPTLDRPTARAVATMRRCHEHIAHRARQALRLLSGVDDLGSPAPAGDGTAPHDQQVIVHRPALQRGDQ
ncbi:dynamin family protein [Verrucosispora sp. TAA-831]|uniref:dynamin family protein n=1 Tax=Verrucosispora sp. TAA-831 TaxID=3422227 RepID=UPI003D6F4C40